MKIIKFETKNQEFENIEIFWNWDSGILTLTKYTNKYKGFIENSWDFEQKEIKELSENAKAYINRELNK